MNEFIFDLQRFADDRKDARESLLPHLRMICNVANTPIFSGFISILENNRDTLDKIDKYISPIFDIVSVFYKKKYPSNAPLKIAEEAELFASTIAISSSLIDVCDRMAGNAFVDASKELGNIANEMLSVCDTLLGLQAKEGINLNKTEEPDDLFIPIITATISYGLATLSTFGEDGLTPEVQSDINKALVKLGGVTLEALLTEVLDDADKFTTPFGVADVGLSVLVGILEGFNKYSTQINYYRDDGLPEDIAKKEAILDAVSGGLHDAMSNYLHGVDDVAFAFGKALGDGCKWIGAFLSGNLDSFEFSNDDKNYVEWVREAAMRASYGTSSFDDEIEIDPANPKTYPTIYAQDGNDRIKNIYPNVTIYGGHGNDSISLYEGARANSVIGGADDDYIYIYDINNTVDGGSGNELFLIVGNKNEIHGADGADVIFIQGGSNNTITSGAEDDLIILQSGAKNNIIEYSQGDGSDVIFGYDTSNLIKVKGGYSVYVSGNDKIIQVDKGGIIVKDAKNLTLNINTIDLEEGETLPEGSGEGFIPYTGGLVLAPRFQDLDEALRGTSTNDRIENTLSNIMIHSGDGDDTIINYGENVTINVGNGTDKVYNYADDVKINGGNGNDYIYNEAARVTMNGNNGNDTVENLGNNSRIDGGDDMDSIKNSGESTDINSGGGNDRILNLASNARVYSYLNDNYINNTKNEVTLEGGSGDDYIFNSGDYVSINASEGNNSVSIDGSVDGYTTIEAGSGNDTIKVGERDETEEKRYYNEIYAGDGNNYINNSNVELSDIIAGAGNDTIITGGGEGWSWNYANHHTSIIAGAGNNQITVNSSMTYGKITAGNGNDLVSISGDGNSNIISVGSGNDSVISGGNYSTINVGAGKNFVTLNANSSSNNVIAGSGDDYIFINDSGDNNSASLGSGNNTLISTNGRETVTAGDGIDKITVKGGDINVGGGKNNVSITYGGNTTVTAGNSDDTINVADKAEEATEARLYNNINAGDGNNYINNSNVELSDIIAGAGNDTIITGGGEGWSWNYANHHTSIIAGAGNNQITVNSSMTYGKITAGNGNDLVSISGDGNSNIISVGEGRNTIFTHHYYDTNYNQYNTIEAGTGSDLIYTSGNSSFINVGSGRNLISLAGGYYNTLVTGKGDDTISLAADANNNVIIFGGGKDIVYGYNSGDTVKSVGELTARTVGTDVILTDGTSKMTLKGAKGKTINTATLSSNDNIYKILVADKTVGDSVLPITIIPNPKTSPVDIFNETGSTLIMGTAYDDTISNIGKKVTINALAGSDYIDNTGANTSINAGNGSDTVDNQGAKITIVGGKGDDYVDNYGKNVSINGGANNDELNNYGNKATILGDAGNDIIRNWGDDNGYGSDVSISGGAGNDSIVNNGGEDVTISGGAGNDSIINSGANVVFNYAKGEGDDTISGFNETSMLSISGSKYSTVKNGSDVVVTVGNNKITLVGAASLSKANVITADPTLQTLNDKSANAVTLATTIKTADASKRTKAIKIVGNTLANTLNGGASNDTLLGAAGNDKMLGNAGNDSVLGGDGADTLAGGDGNDKLFGNAGNDSIAGGDGHDSINGGTDNDKLFGNAGNDSLVGGDGADTLSGSTGDDKLYGDKGNDSLVGGSGDDYLNGGDGVDKLFGESGDDKLYGGAGNDDLSGGTGSDTLSGGSGNDTLTGGKGNDLFIYSAGNDVIADFAAGDKISIGAAISGTSLKGSDATFTINKNTLTVKNGKGKEVTVINAKGKEQTLIGGALIVSKNSTLENWREIADASTATSKVKLTGNAKNNTLFGGSKDDTLVGASGADKLFGNAGNDSISGGDGADTLSGGAGNDKLYGGKGNDSLWGGAGNDSLWGNAGADTFIYANGEGKDVIYNFDNSDILQITGTFTSSYNKSKKEIAFTVGKTASALTLKSFTATSFNINGDTYKISGSKLIK